MMLELMVAASEDDSPWVLLLGGPIGGAATYWLIHRYYRNTDKSHAYERDTIIEADPVRGSEERTGHIAKTRKSGISGDNSGHHRRRVQRLR
ncbi:hypothetical protein KUV85_02665 [Nocardioides panacisoli]|uniref:hypothetical protein n=1 Tax=Nocardioides panacisoli TaxID=627624 RepID=UPI001C636240|nr:hypothetical protein [Nocardioides panacisoli]QYJ04600.1 hypothetical protein KUV85_02665 [Nocardioides panacisoli]